MNITNSIITHPRRFSLLLAILTCLLFLSSTPTVNVGYGDSDEFLAVGHTWGLAHPPGYSLYTSLLTIASKIAVPGTTEAWRMHAVSGVAASIAVYFSLILLFEINLSNVVSKKRLNKQVQIVSLTITMITLATAKLYWLYAQIAEKYIFATPFIALLCLIGYRLIYTPKITIKSIFVFGLTYGLLISHHQSMVFLLPFIAYVIWFAKFKTKLLRFGLVALTILFGLILPLGITAIQSGHAAEPSWHIEPGIKGLTALVTRNDFRGTLYASNTPTSGYFPKQITLSQITNGTLHYFKILFESISWWPIAPLLLAIVTLFKKNKPLLALFSIPPICIGLCLASYLNWPLDLGSQATTIRFYIPSLITWSPLIFIGIYELLYRLRQFFVVLGSTKKVASVIISSIIILPIAITIFSYSDISLKKFNVISQLYSQILNTVKPNSVLTCYSDSSCFALLYEQTVNKRRPDVDIVPLAYPLVLNNIQGKKLAGFTYPDNPYLMLDIVSWNIGKRPVYAVNISQYYFSLFGFDNGILSYAPEGYAAEINREIPQTTPLANYQLTRDYTKLKYPEFDLMRRYLVQSIAQIHFSNGYIWLRMGDRPKAQSEFSLGMNLAYQLTDSEKTTAQGISSQLERTQPNQNYRPGSKSITSTKLLSYLPDLLKGNHNSQAFAISRSAVLANPRDTRARIEFAKIFQLMGDKTFALREFRHVLMLDPSNQDAQQAINMILQ